MTIDLRDPMQPAHMVRDALGLSPHPEGGHYRELWRDRPPSGERGAGTSILFLLAEGERSHWHRVDAAEIWLWQAGAPLLLGIAGTDGHRENLRLGPNVAGGEALTVKGDVADPKACMQIVAETTARFGRLDGLINNAGLMLGRVNSLEASDEHLRAEIDLNSSSVIWVTRAAVPWLEREGGFIINTTSIAARNGGAGGAMLYAAAKGFVSTITRGHAKELIGKKIRVNAVSPGVIATPFHERYTDAAAMEAIRKTIPIARIGTAEECVGAYLFLASEALSGYVVGQIIEVNGGQLMP